MADSPHRAPNEANEASDASDTSEAGSPSLPPTLLESRWSKLDLPRYPLLRGPTPLEFDVRLSKRLGGELWIKHDDLTHPDYGGNKVRKLERLIGDALQRGADTLITTGAAGSHHVLATTLFGRRAGLAVHAVLIPQASSEHVTLNLRAMLRLGAELHPVHHGAAVPTAMAALATRLKFQRKRPYLIPPGGSNAVGAIGYVEAGLELGQQMLEARAPEFDAIVVPLGSGGTVAGLALGLATAGCVTPIHAVRVAAPHLVGRPFLHAQIRGALDLLRRGDDRFPRILDQASELYRIEESELGPGYGLPTSRARDAIRLGDEHSLHLDGTYTGKTFAHVVRLLAEGRAAQTPRRVLYVHTLSSAPMRPLVEDAPSVPHRLDRLLE